MCFLCLHLRMLVVTFRFFSFFLNESLRPGNAVYVKVAVVSPGQFLRMLQNNFRCENSYEDEPWYLMEFFL